MTQTRKAIRKAYRAEARSKMCTLDFWAFVVSLWVITFFGVAVLSYFGNAIGDFFFKEHKAYEQDVLANAFRWANLIEGFFLVAILVLYVWGGLAGMPFLHSKKDGKDQT